MVINGNGFILNSYLVTGILERTYAPEMGIMPLLLLHKLQTMCSNTEWLHSLPSWMVIILFLNYANYCVQDSQEYHFNHIAQLQPMIIAPLFMGGKAIQEWNWLFNNHIKLHELFKRGTTVVGPPHSLFLYQIYDTFYYRWLFHSTELLHFSALIYQIFIWSEHNAVCYWENLYIHR